MRRALRTLPAEVGLSLITADPAVSTLAATAAQRRVDRLLDGPRSVRYRGVEARLSPGRLGSLVESGPRAGTLAVTLDPEGLAAALRPRLGRFERSPRDASFVPAGKRVRITPSRDGLLLDGERIGTSLLKNLGARAHLARFVESPPELTTTAAKGLGIRELVSEFTTYHPCCAPRVSNIHRAADIMDGTIVLPGRRFSLNEVLGKRTVERGFVTAPQIFNGRLEDAVGGGVSQIATTTYNAAFFAGVQILTHQPHQFYISRYPMGREATVSWGGPELIWRNDWPAADPRRHVVHGHVDHRALLLVQARPPGGDGDRRALLLRAAPVDRGAEPIAAAGCDERDPGGGSRRIHDQLHAQGVPLREAAPERALHLALRRRGRSHRGRAAAEACCQAEALCQAEARCQAEAGARGSPSQ